MDNNEIQSFIDAYRDSLGKQKDLELQGLENARRNAYQSIMGSANAAGMMYSNFPERTKLQYDTNTYMPAITKVNQTYQTGLDTLRNNITNTWNSIQDLKDATATLNKASDPMSKYAINDAGDYVFWDDATGTTQYRNKDKQNIRFGTAAQRAGYTTPEDIIKYAGQTLKGQDEMNRLGSIWERAKNAGYTGIGYNVGDAFTPATGEQFSFLNDAERDFIDSLGLTFTQ